MDGGRTSCITEHWDAVGREHSGTFGVYRLSISYLDTFYADGEVARLAGLHPHARLVLAARRTSHRHPGVLAMTRRRCCRGSISVGGLSSEAAVPNCSAHAQRNPGAPPWSSAGADDLREFDERANGVAHALLASGLESEELVAIRLERSEWAIVAMLGILKAGGAYVPLDPNAPATRTELILRDANCRYVISDGKLAGAVDGVHAFDVERIAERSAKRPEVRSNGSSLAYVIYTSGSTGTPKVRLSSTGRCASGPQHELRRDRSRRPHLAGRSIAFARVRSRSGVRCSTAPASPWLPRRPTDPVSRHRARRRRASRC